jgi:hypothetical protein
MLQSLQQTHGRGVHHGSHRSKSCSDRQCESRRASKLLYFACRGVGSRDPAFRLGTVEFCRQESQRLLSNAALAILTSSKPFRRNGQANRNSFCNRQFRRSATEAAAVLACSFAFSAVETTGICGSG